MRALASDNTALTTQTLSTYYKHNTRNTYYFNFDPSPGFMVEYSYEFFTDGHFGVNIFGMPNMEKGMCYDSWNKYLWFHES
jgi:hypothetical protein